MIDNKEVGFLLSNSNVHSKRRAARCDAMMKTFNILEPQLPERGIAVKGSS